MQIVKYVAEKRAYKFAQVISGKVNRLFYFEYS